MLALRELYKQTKSIHTDTMALHDRLAVDTFPDTSMLSKSKDPNADKLSWHDQSDLWLFAYNTVAGHVDHQKKAFEVMRTEADERIAELLGLVKSTQDSIKASYKQARTDDDQTSASIVTEYAGNISRFRDRLHVLTHSVSDVGMFSNWSAGVMRQISNRLSLASNT